jgi:hypothetical protein
MREGHARKRNSGASKALRHGFTTRSHGAGEAKTVTQSKGCPVAFGFDIGNQLFRDIYYEYLKLAET